MIRFPYVYAKPQINKKGDDSEGFLLSSLTFLTIMFLFHCYAYY